MTDEKELLLKSASEPTILNDVRTSGYWVRITRTKEGYKYTFGDERGQLAHKISEELEFLIANFYMDKVRDCQMTEATKKEIAKENESLTLEDIVRLYGEEGDYLKEGMDAFLDKLKEEVKIKYTYKNLMDSSSGFFAKAILRRKGEKIFVFFDYDGSNSHMIREIEVA